MQSLLRAAQLLVSDLASTIAFLIVLLATQDVMLAVAIGIALGAAQIGWLLVRRKPIDTMQWLSIGLVIVSGVATMVTNDPRFVMLKPSVIYCVVGAFMLRPGWMNRYLPPIVIQLIPDVVYAFGFIWAGLMFASAALNIVLAMALDPLTWAASMAAWGIASKVVLFLVQYATMRTVAVRRRRAASLATGAAEGSS